MGQWGQGFKWGQQVQRGSGGLGGSRGSEGPGVIMRVKSVSGLGGSKGYEGQGVKGMREVKGVKR